MPRNRHTLFLPALLALAGILVATPYSFAEENKKKSQKAFSGVISKDDQEGHSRLRELLGTIDASCPKIPQKCPITDELYGEVFGDLNNRNLPIIFVYVDKDYQVRAHHLFWRRKATPFVYGVQQVWVLLFSERPVTVEAELTHLYNGHSGIVQGLRNVFISSGRRTTENRESRAMSKGIELQPWITEAADEDNLWFGGERFYLDVDAGYNVSVRPADEATREAVEFERIDVRFTNSKRRSVDFGIGIGFTGDISAESLEEDDDVSGIRTEDGIVSLYWLMHAYIRRPTLLDPIGRRVGSRYRVSYAVTFGFNLDVLNVDQMIVGFNIGHLFGRHGIVVGANFLDLLDSQETTVTKPFFAVSFNF